MKESYYFHVMSVSFSHYIQFSIPFKRKFLWFYDKHFRFEIHYKMYFVLYNSWFICWTTTTRKKNMPRYEPGIGIRCSLKNPCKNMQPSQFHRIANITFRFIRIFMIITWRCVRCYLFCKCRQNKKICDSVNVFLVYFTQSNFILSHIFMLHR